MFFLGLNVKATKINLPVMHSTLTLTSRVATKGSCFDHDLLIICLLPRNSVYIMKLCPFFQQGPRKDLP